MRLTPSLSSNSTTFKLIEAAANRLQIASSEMSDDAIDTATFLLRKMDAEAASLERDIDFSRQAKNLKSEIENKGVRCTVYRFHNDGQFGGYTFCLSGLTECGQQIGEAYVHLIDDGNRYCVNASLKYRSPYKLKKTFVLPKTNLAKIWDFIETLGYEKPKVNLLELNIESFVEHEENLGSSKCIDLKHGASYQIAEKIRKQLAKKFKSTKVIEANDRYTVIASKPNHF